MKHVHFIGICGVTMAAVAKMYLDMGWRVSGSDAGFFPPMSDYLKRQPGIKFYPGWHPEKLTSPPDLGEGWGEVLGRPDLTIIGNFIGLNNPEFKYVREQKIPYKSYPEVLEEYVIKENSIVVAGTAGKTTISALLAWILEEQGLRPSYMTGGLPLNLPDGVRATDARWSVVEGDEYPASRWQNNSKFLYYRPKVLLLTSADWDHMDVFKTEEAYVKNMKEVVAMLPPDGLIIANGKGTNIDKVVADARCPVVYYKDKIGYNLALFTRKTGEIMIVENKNKKYTEDFRSQLIGVHNLDNVMAAIALATEIGLEQAKLKSAVASFKGVRRRLEIRGRTKNNSLVIDDLAHSPVKAKSSIMALRDWYPESKVYAVFEPNIGSRTPQAVTSYLGKFNMASEVIIPRLSSAKTSQGEVRYSGEELVQEIKRMWPHVSYGKDDQQLTAELEEKAGPNDIILFMGSRGFRGMIEQLVGATSRQ